MASGAADSGSIPLRNEYIMYKILDGNQISKSILDELKNKCSEYIKVNKKICMVDIMVGDDEASKVYIENKKKKFDYVGIEFQQLVFNSDISESELISKIEELNNDNTVNAIFIEMPLPKGINEKHIIDKIAPNKDVDGFGVKSLGALLQGNSGFFPCTAEGIVELLKKSNIELSGKNCVVLGRSNVVGKPVSILLLNENATVTICHSKTKNLKEVCNMADILVVALGKARFIDDTYVKNDAIVIDVGIHRFFENDKKIVCGDVDFDKVAPKTSFITPVPGGVGPMTVAMLIKHCVETIK